MKISKPEQGRRRDFIPGMVTGLLGLLLAVGAQTFARPCVHADGSAAVCAGVRTWLTLEGGLIAVLAGISVIRPIPAVQAAAAVCGLLAALTPGVLVPICRHDTMACRQVTQPTALVLGILIMAVALCRTVMTLSAKKRGHDA